MSLSNYALSTAEKSRIAEGGYGVPLEALGIQARELDELNGLIQMLCSGWTKRFTVQPQRTRAVLTDSPTGNNAWAWDLFSGQNEHVVLFHANLLDKMCRYAGQVETLVEIAIDSNEGQDLFRPIWDDLPNDESHRAAFASLLLHAMVVFVTLHEMAHIAFSHRDFYPTEGQSEAPIDEHSKLTGEWDLSKLRSQALELDADIHALEWMREYLELNRKRLVEAQIVDDQATCAVWNRFVATPEGIRFLVVCGSWMSLLILGAKKFHPNQLTSGTHPISAVRMGVLVHFENAANARRTNTKSNYQVAAADFALCLYAMVSLTEGRLEKLKTETIEEAFRPIREPLEVAKRNSGIAGVFASWDAVGVAANDLAQERAQIEKRMAKVRRVPPEYLVAWFQEKAVV